MPCPAISKPITSRSRSVKIGAAAAAPTSAGPGACRTNHQCPLAVGHTGPATNATPVEPSLSATGLTVLAAEQPRARWAFAAREAALWRDESAYARIMQTRPLKRGYAMADSPVGVAAWIAEAFHAWSNLRDRSFEQAIPPDGLLDEIMLYVVTDAARSPLRQSVSAYAV